MTLQANFASRPIQRLAQFWPVSMLSGLAMAGFLACWSPVAYSQIQHPLTPASGSASAKPLAAGTAWSQLSPMQKQALAPLASSWNTTMSETQKRKWLEISKNYSTMTPQAQAMLNSRMSEWVALSPQQRAQARLNFGKTRELSRQLTPEEKKAKWAAYQALSPEEKQKLAASASPKPSGAATAVKPVAPHKLAPFPAQAASRQALRPASKIELSPAVSVPGVAPVPALASSSASPQR